MGQLNSGAYLSHPSTCIYRYCKTCVEGNNSKEASEELERAVLDVTTETVTSDDTEYEDEEDEEEEEENEEDMDEYEEELREVAESHEAMSRDDRSNFTTVNHSEVSGVHDDVKTTRNFDSHEKSVEEGSDESITSNEAISNESELEREKNAEYKQTTETKSKRVPTVKKELSTQKELQSNETIGSETPEIIGKLEERRVGYSQGRTREIIDNDLIDQGNSWYWNKNLVNQDFDENRRIEKRNKLNQNILLGSLLPQFLVELKRKWNLHKVETEEWAQAESLMKLLVKLAENPGRWERAHKLLKDVEDDLELSSPMDSKKRGYSIDQSGLITTISPNPPNEKLPPKKPKKKKKKKKKPKHQIITTTLQPPTLTTQKLFQKPETHWRLVAERLFGPTWSTNRKDQKNYSILQNITPKTSTQSTNYNDKFINDELSHEYNRKFHFGKVNTHEKGSSFNQPDSSSNNYDLNTNSDSHVLDYDIQERNYERPRVKPSRYDRYHHYIDRIREFGDDSIEDYGDTYPDVEYPRRHGFYGKSWRYSRYEQPRSTDGYYEDNRKNFERYRPWTIIRPVIELDDDEINPPRFYNKFNSQWPVERNVNSPWRLITQPRNIFRNSKLSMPINKNRIIKNETIKTKINNDELSRKNNNIKTWNNLNSDNSDKNVVIPKLTMKTWNSLTSDPATWPFKLSGAKPWPKDKNGKSYNPNAELVRKLGLDKQTMMLEKDNDKNSKNSKNEINKATSLPHIDDSGIWKDDRKIWQWQGKLNDWNVEFGKQEESSTWRPKWKQFSYHKVNGGNIIKQGNNLDGSKVKNSFIAMSAVTPSRYPNNEWRKNDIDENIYHNDGIDRDDPANQLLTRQDNSIGQWIKNTNFKRQNINRTDILENQLENLRGKNINNLIVSTQPTYLQSTISQSRNSTTNTTKSMSLNVENNEINEKSNNTIK